MFVLDILRYTSLASTTWNRLEPTDGNCLGAHHGGVEQVVAGDPALDKSRERWYFLIWTIHQIVNYI